MSAPINPSQILATVITGASGGIGEALARQFAATEKQPLVLVARRAEKLISLAKELQATHGIRVDTVGLDLEQPGSAKQLLEAVASRGMVIDTLVNNAGFGINERFADTPEDRIVAMMQLNMVTLTELCHAVLPGMRARKKGRIMNVSSIGGFAPCPRFATYSATKAYVLSLTEALAAEEKPNGIHVTAVCPGATKTEFHDVAGNNDTLIVKMMDTPEMVARSGIRALNRGRAIIVTGLMNKPLPFFYRLLPRAAIIWASNLLVSR